MARMTKRTKLFSYFMWLITTKITFFGRSLKYFLNHDQVLLLIFELSTFRNFKLNRFNYYAGLFKNRKAFKLIMIIRVFFFLSNIRFQFVNLPFLRTYSESDGPRVKIDVMSWLSGIFFRTNPQNLFLKIPQNFVANPAKKYY